MKLKTKHWLLLLGALVAPKFGEAENMARAESATDAPHRKIYAFFLSNFDFGKGNYGIGSFYADSPEESELWNSFAAETSYSAFYAGAAANGVYYGASYLFVDGAPPQAQDLIAVEMRTGEKRTIGPWAEDPDMKLQDMTYNYKDSTMYALCHGYEYFEREDGTQGSYVASRLYTIDLETGKAVKKVVLDTAMAYGAIAAGYEGRLYLMGNDGVLYSADKETGKVTPLCETEYKRPSQFWGSEVDHTDNTLYWAVSSHEYDQGDAYHLIRFDLNADPVTFEDLGTITSSESEAVLYGLYIPFVLAGEDAPAAPTALAVTPDPTGALKATLKWTTPELDFGGDPLAGLASVKILRDGQEVLDTAVTENGKAMEWVDENVPTRGYHEYILIAVNAEGEGEKAYINRYVGPDVPAKITGVEVIKTDGCTELGLSWEKSQGGENGSYVDPESVSYRIERYPDSVVVAENLKETIFTDKEIEVLDGYSYGIFAVNEVGETVTVTDVNVAGPALDPSSWFTDFASAEDIARYWTRVDQNRDNWTWAVSTIYGYHQFQEFYPALEYFVNPGVNAGMDLKDADDYFITPPFLFKTGMGYRISFDYRCVTDEKLEITVGTTNTAGSQAKIGTMDLLPSDPYVEFGYMEMDLPALEKDGIRTIGLHLISPLPDNLFSFLQISNLTIEETGPVANRTTAVLEDVRVDYANDRIRIIGEFDYAEIFSATGTKVLGTGQNIIDTEALAQGVYLVRVVRDGESRTFKVVVL